MILSSMQKARQMAGRNANARIDEVLQAIANMGNAFGRQDNGGPIERFLKLNPPQFEGLGEPEEAEKWIWEMEKIFK